MRAEALLSLILIFAPWTAHAGERQLRFECKGLEAYDITAAYNVDAGAGSIRARDGNGVIGMTLGPMVEELVPAERPPGFRTYHSYVTHGVTVRYGQNVREKQFQATLIGAPMNGLIDLVAPPTDAELVLKIARILTTARCRVQTLAPQP